MGLFITFMSFNNYKSIGQVLQDFPLIYEEKLILKTMPLVINPYFRERLLLVIQEGVVFNSEYAICENIISPILTEMWRIYKEKCLLWSHQPLNYDEQLSGIPDYIIAKRSPRGKVILDQPYLVIVEAKKDNFEEGWGQCLAELIAAQKINQKPEHKIFGIVSNGKLWEFAQLKNDIFTKNTKSYLLDNLEELMATINFIFQEIIKQL
jgi:hypothetical protein